MNSAFDPTLSNRTAELQAAFAARKNPAMARNPDLKIIAGTFTGVASSAVTALANNFDDIARQCQAPNFRPANVSQNLVYRAMQLLSVQATQAELNQAKQIASTLNTFRLLDPKKHVCEFDPKHLMPPNRDIKPESLTEMQTAIGGKIKFTDQSKEKTIELINAGSIGARAKSRIS